MKRLYLTIILLLIPCIPGARERLFIDVTNPNVMPISFAVQAYYAGEKGMISEKIVNEIISTIKNDLNMTGYFNGIDERTFLERPEENFRPENWKVTGADIVVKLSLSGKGNSISLAAEVFDVGSSMKVISKEYSAEVGAIRPLSHSVSRDIYRTFTDREPVFDSKILFVGRYNKKLSLYIMDWDGARLTRLGISDEMVVSPRWSERYKALVYTAFYSGRWVMRKVDFNTMTQRNIFESKDLAVAGDLLSENDLLASITLDGNQDIYLLNIRDNNIKKITGTIGIEVEPRLSPDRKKIAFVSDMSGSPQIYICDINGYNVKRLTFSGRYNTSPEWSPATDMIAYTGSIDGRNQIFLLKLDSLESIQLTENGNNEDPSFSPDGRFITFTSDRDGYKRIYIMRIDGTMQIPLTKDYGMSPVWIKW